MITSKIETEITQSQTERNEVEVRDVTFLMGRFAPGAATQPRGTTSVCLDSTTFLNTTFGGGPNTNVFHAQKIPENKHELYPFFEDGEFNLPRSSELYQRGQVLFAGTNRGREIRD